MDGWYGWLSEDVGKGTAIAMRTTTTRLYMLAFELGFE